VSAVRRGGRNADLVGDESKILVLDVVQIEDLSADVIAVCVRNQRGAGVAVKIGKRVLGGEVLGCFRSLLRRAIGEERIKIGRR
jgi:hypothetical protein